MTNMDIIIEAIEQAGFLPLASNEENAGAFEAEGLRFGWEAKDGEAVFYTSLGILPQHPSTELCERLLEADCLGIGTGGGHIGLHGPTRTLLYSFRTRVDGADVPRLADMLSDFVGRAPAFIRETEDFRAAASDEGAAPFSGAMLWV